MKLYHLFLLLASSLLVLGWPLLAAAQWRTVPRSCANGSCRAARTVWTGPAVQTYQIVETRTAPAQETVVQTPLATVAVASGQNVVQSGGSAGAVVSTGSAGSAGDAAQTVYFQTWEPRARPVLRRSGLFAPRYVEYRPRVRVTVR